MIEAPDALVFPFGELGHLTVRYAQYLRVKREGFAYKLQAFSPLWECWMAFDEAWDLGLNCISLNTDLPSRLGAFLYMIAHAKTRVALDTAFSGCLSEGRSVIRDAIEFVAHAHRVSNDLDLAALWVNKDTRKTEWEEAFWHNKRTVLFSGMGVLYKRWSYYSNIGSHANLDAIAASLKVENIGQGILEFSYVMQAGEALFDKGLRLMILDAVHCFQVFFKDWGSHIQDQQFRLAHARANEILAKLSSE